MSKVLVDEAIQIDRRMKEDKKRLDEIKAKLTEQALTEMDNKNLKYLQVYGETGKFNVFYKEKFEVDRYNELVNILGELAEGKIAKKVETKYEVDSKFKAALIALFKGEYSSEIDISNILAGLGLEVKTIKAVSKKLKGDYIADKKLLESVGITGDLEEELDAIRMYKNWEKVNRFFGELSDEQISKIKQTIFVEESISVGFDYQQ